MFEGSENSTKSCREKNVSFERERGGEKVSGTHLIIIKKRKEIVAMDEKEEARKKKQDFVA